MWSPVPHISGRLLTERFPGRSVQNILLSWSVKNKTAPVLKQDSCYFHKLYIILKNSAGRNLELRLNSPTVFSLPDLQIAICGIILPTFPIFQGLQSLVWWNDMYFPLFLPLWDNREGNKGNFFLVIACHLVEKPCWISLSFSGGVSIDIHCGTDIWVP